MTQENLAELIEALHAATHILPGVTSKKMFGCPALWVNGNIFAIVWKHGRIGFKLPNENTYSTLLNLQGAEPWQAGAMKMSHWVLVPESFHQMPSELSEWATKAHHLCSTLEQKPKKNKKER